MEDGIGRRQSKCHESRQPHARNIINTLNKGAAFFRFIRRNRCNIQSVLVSRAAYRTAPLCQSCNGRNSVYTEQWITPPDTLAEGQFKASVARYKSNDSMGIGIIIYYFSKRYHHRWRHGDHDHVRMTESLSGIVRSSADVCLMKDITFRTDYSQMLFKVPRIRCKHCYLMPLFRTVDSKLSPDVSSSYYSNIHDPFLLFVPQSVDILHIIQNGLIRTQQKEGKIVQLNTHFYICNSEIITTRSV